MQMVVTRRLSFLNFSSSTPTSSSPHYHWTRLTHFGNILCDVAGIMMCPQMETQDGFEMQMGVNHLGHFYLTNLLQELLIKSSPSRIINVASSAHQICLNGLQFDDLQSRKSYGPLIAYGKSKLANILFTLELSRRLEGIRAAFIWNFGFGLKLLKRSVYPGRVEMNEHDEGLVFVKRMLRINQTNQV